MEKSVKKQSKALPIIEVVKEKGAIGLSFQYNRVLVNIIRTLPRRWWDPSRKIWWVPDNVPSREALREAFLGKVQFIVPGQVAPKKEVEPVVLVQMQTKMQQLGYHPSTIKTYAAHFKEFLGYFPMRQPETIQEHEIRGFLDILVKAKDISYAYLDQTIAALRFFYEGIQGRPIMDLLPAGSLSHKNKSQMLTSGLIPQLDEYLKSA